MHGSMNVKFYFVFARSQFEVPASRTAVLTLNLSSFRHSLGVLGLIPSKSLTINYPLISLQFVSPDRVQPVATRYGLDGPGIESWWGRNVPGVSRPALRPTQPPIQWVPGLSRG